MDCCCDAMVSAFAVHIRFGRLQNVSLKLNSTHSWIFIIVTRTVYLVGSCLSIGMYCWCQRRVCHNRLTCLEALSVLELQDAAVRVCSPHPDVRCPTVCLSPFALSCRGVSVPSRYVDGPSHWKIILDAFAN